MQRQRGGLLGPGSFDGGGLSTVDQSERSSMASTSGKRSYSMSNMADMELTFYADLYRQPTLTVAELQPEDYRRDISFSKHGRKEFKLSKLVLDESTHSDSSDLMQRFIYERCVNEFRSPARCNLTFVVAINFLLFIFS